MAEMAERERKPSEPSLVERIRVHITDVVRAEDQNELSVFDKRLKEDLRERREAARSQADQLEKKTP